MKIAIIGAGNVGTALATSFKKAGHDVVIASRDPEDAGGAVASTGAQLAGSNAEAAAAGDVVILAVPFTSAPQIATEIAEAAAGKVVIDVTNRMSFGPAGPDIDTTSSNAEELAALLPKSRVVKAFNTLFASKQHDPIAEGLQLDGFVAGDDAQAKEEVGRLLASIGLNPIDVGPLARARQLEGMAFLNISLNIARGGSWQSGWKLIGAPSVTKAA
jgi:NADPH-dependent F420 reductase